MAGHLVALRDRGLFVATMLLLAAMAGCQPVEPGPQPPASGAGPAGAAATRPAPPAAGPAGAGAELELAWLPGGSAFTIDLRNTGRAPIKADRELVLLVSIRALDANGSGMECEKLDAPRKPASFADRFTTIEPGKSIRRTVDLKKGFDHYVWGYVSTLDLTEHLPWAWVGRDRLPAAARPAAVEVDYNAAGFMYAEDFKHYTRLDLDKLGLYRGPLTKKLAWAAR